MTTLVETSLEAQPVSSLDHGCSQTSQYSQQFASTFGGGKPVFDATTNDGMGQRGRRSNAISMSSQGKGSDDCSPKKRKHEEECPEDFMTQRSQDDAMYQSSQSPVEGLLTVSKAVPADPDSLLRARSWKCFEIERCSEYCSLAGG